MRIQHNIMAMNAYRNYNNNTKALSKNLERLSSGYKINRAGDDAAGLAISEKMRAQITGLEAAQKNVKDGTSLVNTAEGAMQEVQDMLNRMVYLATQSSNGTYDDAVDRKNLQAEVDQLKEEINRIADSANFNGIKLMDGSMNKTEGITGLDTLSSTSVNAVQTSKLGSIDAAKIVDGKLTAGDEGTLYQASFYIGEFTNSNAADKNIVINYNDASGAAKTITLAIEAGKSVTTEDIAKALNSGSAAGGVKTVTDAGTAASQDTTSKLAQNGKFSELYTAEAQGDILVIKAKVQTGENVVAGAPLDTGKIGTVTLDTTALDAADVKKATDKLVEDWNADKTETPIAFGAAAKQETANVDPTDGKYRVASLELALTGTGKDLHNQGIKVGDTTYVIQSGGAELKGVPDDAKIIKVGDTDTAAQVAAKLAAAITADEQGNGGYVAKTAGSTITISESVNYGNMVLEDNGADPTLPGKNGNFVEQLQFTTSPASTTLSGTLTVDADKMGNGTTITVGDKSYMITRDSTLSAPKGATKIVVDADATSDDIAKKLADQMTADGFTTVAANGANVTLTNVTVNGSVSASAAGLKLQIGDTSDGYNQLNVSIQDMHTNSLGIDGIDISNPKGAAEAINVVRNAINTVSSIRGNLGAISNRLDHTANNLSVMRENIQDAESSIRDTDIAEEMMSYTKNNILVQSAQAMLAQANQVPQGVLQLLQ